jgi:hypothetical protein
MSQKDEWSETARNLYDAAAERAKGLPLHIYECEPQEVSLFEDAIKKLKSNKPRMIELGCAEAQYSHIFWKATGGTNVCLDILPRQIGVAKKYCPNAEFIHGYVGEKVHHQEIKEDNYGAKKIPLDSLISESKRVDILHMDIQGAEEQTTQELKEKELYQFIDYLFISTHKNHLNVLKHIPEEFKIIFDKDNIAMNDGLIVARNPNYEGEISE